MKIKYSVIDFFSKRADDTQSIASLLALKVGVSYSGHDGLLTMSGAADKAL